MEMQIFEQDKIFIILPIRELEITFISDKDSDKLCGAWKDKRSAEKIIKDIYRSRRTSSQLKPEL